MSSNDHVIINAEWDNKYGNGGGVRDGRGEGGATFGVFNYIVDMKDTNGDSNCELQFRSAKLSFVWMIEHGVEIMGLFHRTSRRMVYKWIEVNMSYIVRAGMGLFSCQDILTGEILTVYVGRVINPTAESIYKMTNRSIVFD